MTTPHSTTHSRSRLAYLLLALQLACADTGELDDGTDASGDLPNADEGDQGDDEGPEASGGADEGGEDSGDEGDESTSGGDADTGDDSGDESGTGDGEDEGSESSDSEATGDSGDESSESGSDDAGDTEETSGDTTDGDDRCTEVSEGHALMRLPLRPSKGEARLEDYAPGIDAAMALMECVMERSIEAGPNEHPIDIASEDLNIDNPPGTVTSGVAITPRPEDFGDRPGNMSLDIAIKTQAAVFGVMMHEAMHTMSVLHVGEGIMLSGGLPNYAFLDQPVAEALAAVGIKFIDPIDSRLANGEEIPLTELLQTYVGPSYEELQAMAITPP